ncbi:MAG: hypothetical protein KGI93_12860, partial [Acidobacteriota bacterium]|nr:hypothetical protein [Acidobacteriota bacterium]
IDIQSDTEFAQAEADVAFGGGGGEEELSGRCGAILANGKRCPNAALPGSRFCGVAAHQALALEDVPADEEPVVPEDEPELEAEISAPEAESVGPSLGGAEEEPAARAPEPALAPLDEVPAGIPVESQGAESE